MLKVTQSLSNDAPLLVTVEPVSSPLALDRYMNIAPSYARQSSNYNVRHPLLGTAWVEAQNNTNPDPRRQVKGCIFVASGIPEHAVIDDDALYNALFYVRRFAAYRHIPRVVIRCFNPDMGLTLIKGICEVFGRSTVGVELFSENGFVFPEGTLLSVERVEQGFPCIRLSLYDNQFIAEPAAVGLPDDGLSDGDKYSYDAQYSCWRVDNGAKAESLERVTLLWNSLNFKSSQH